jgi:hypothetical protein
MDDWMEEQEEEIPVEVESELYTWSETDRQITFARELARQLSYSIGSYVSTKAVLEAFSHSIFKLELDDVGVMIDARKSLEYDTKAEEVVDISKVMRKKRAEETWDIY